MGLFPLKIQTLVLPVSSTGDKGGRDHSFTLLFVHYLISDLLIIRFTQIHKSDDHGF
jgi:hypothetical protein